MNIETQLYKNFNQYNKNKTKNEVKNENLKGFLLKNNILNNNLTNYQKEKAQTSSILQNSSINIDNNDINKFFKETNDNKEQQSAKEDNPNTKLLKPLVLASSALILGSLIISLAVNKYSKHLLNKTNLIQPEDLARNMNIVEEPEFAMFRLLRQPNAKNILGFLGVGLFSGFSLGAKNFIDGYQEIWITKQNYNTNHQLQKDLIDVEAKSFSGKLDVINDLLKSTTTYFKNTFSNPSNITKHSLKLSPNINFNQKPLISFTNTFNTFVNSQISHKSNNLETNNLNTVKISNVDNGFNSCNSSNIDDKTRKVKKVLLGAFGFVSVLSLAYLMFKNYQKTIGNFSLYQKNLENKILTVDKNEIFNLEDKTQALKRLKQVLISTRADTRTIEADVKKIKGVSEEEIKKFIDDINDINIYTNADKAIYGTSGKIQYYCYINDNRGHLYNWILNPDNKFNKYLFLSFSTITSIAYISKSALEAVKKVTVNKENSKSELELRKKLVDVEINNFKAKKLSVINPLLEDFNCKLKKGESRENLVNLAENILLEIKNGPPYVYA